MIAGLNAALKVQQRDAWCPRRDEAYVGVLIDDLTTHGTTEPYRMFTSRAEYRLQLREDNADTRLTERGHELGCVDESRRAAFARKRDAVGAERARLSRIFAAPNNALGSEIASTLGITLTREASAEELLRRPELDYAKLMQVASLGPGVDDPAVAEQIEVGIKYAGYLDRQNDEIDRQRRHEQFAIPQEFDYAHVRGLGAEVVQKLARVRPQTIGQAARISGVTPAAISLLLVHLRRNEAADVARSA